MTLGVMALETEPTQENDGEEVPQVKTVASALSLLNSLKPQIKKILVDDAALKVPLEVLDVLKTERIRKNIGERGGSSQEADSNDVGAGVLFIGPQASSTPNDEKAKLLAVCGKPCPLIFSLNVA